MPYESNFELYYTEKRLCVFQTRENIDDVGDDCCSDG